MIPITTVTYTPDKWLTLLQAHSIEKFVDEPTTHYVYIQDSKTSRLEWESLLKPIYKKHKLVLMDTSTHPEYSIFDIVKIGWFDQQYTKLMMPRDIEAEYILSLDAKNFFKKPISLAEQFYDKDGACAVESIESLREANPEWFKFWQSWMSIITDVTGLPTPDNLWFPATPFVFKKSHIDKIHAVKDNLKNLFTVAKERNSMISEYVLYAYYSNPQMYYWRDWCSGFSPSDSSEIVKDTESPMFVLSRKVLDDVPGVKEKLIDYLVNRIGLDERYVVPAVNLTSCHNR